MVTATITKLNQTPIDIVFDSIEQPRIVFPELRVRTPHGSAFIAGNHAMDPFRVVVNADYVEAFEALIDGACFSTMSWLGTTGYEIHSSEVWVLDEQGFEKGAYLLYHRNFTMQFPNDEIR